MNRRVFLQMAAVAAGSRLAGLAAEPEPGPAELGAGLGRFRIWDAHCHVNSPGDTPPERMEHLLKAADRMGIERMCIFMGAPWYFDPTPEQFRKTNDDVLEILRHFGSRAFGFVYLNPRYRQESLAELERCVADGPMVGVKLWVAVKCSRPELDPIVQRAAELKAVILQHNYLKNEGRNNLPGESTPADLVELAARHPGIKFVGAHTGGSGWELGIRVVRPQPNIYAETSGSDPCAGWVDLAVRELGAERIIYGSDASGRSFASQLSKVLGARIPDQAKQLIFRDNLRSLLLPILQAKGMSA